VSGNGTGALTDGLGGGIYTSNSGALTINNSTVTGNVTNGSGGGINTHGALTLTNATISGNSAGLGGGGIWYNGPGDHTLALVNSTITGNDVYSEVTSNDNGYGGGIFTYQISKYNVLRNSIVAGNTDKRGAPDVFGNFTSQGYNLIGNTSGSSGWRTTDLQNRASLLGPLQNNGGPQISGESTDPRTATTSANC
jgi:hypothetical protein